MRRWLARLAFSFIVLAMVLAWEGHRAAAGARGPEARQRVTAYYLGAALALAAGLAGLRERHRGMAKGMRVESRRAEKRRARSAETEKSRQGTEMKRLVPIQNPKSEIKNPKSPRAFLIQA